MLKIGRRQAGDTIIEVMIVLAILGSAIGISYAIANKSLANTRSAQENAEATALLQAQVEAFHFISPTADLTTLATQHFCLDTSASTPTVILNTNPIPVAAGCLINNLYSIDISHPGGPANEFTFKATWPDLQQKSYNDSVTLVYRAYH
jgi:prepilin-type N-terminal cleavage/methylation domain-containing protein